ncbi:hypothetical protein CRUP_028228 [Coryphaenoides rupestris]|nr:hypothetical protein CRUP_028228 [Coryphaenoides rupestris]
MVILRDKIRFYEGQKLLDSLAETWDFFFCDVLSMLQAIFYPVQGKEPSVRQLALLHFRNKVVSPYLGTHGLYSSDETATQHYSCCILDKHMRRRLPGGTTPGAKNPVVRSKSYNVPMLTPVAEFDMDCSAAPAPVAAVRRHSVGEMTSCAEECGTSAPPEPAGHAPEGVSSDVLPDPKHRPPADLQAHRAHSPCVLPEPSPASHAGSSPSPSSFSSSTSSSSCCRVRLPHPNTTTNTTSTATSSGPSLSSSPEALLLDTALESLDSETESDGIFLDFSRRSRCSPPGSVATYARDSARGDDSGSLRLTLRSLARLPQV